MMNSKEALVMWGKVEEWWESFCNVVKVVEWWGNICSGVEGGGMVRDKCVISMLAGWLLCNGDWSLIVLLFCNFWEVFFCNVGSTYTSPDVSMHVYFCGCCVLLLSDYLLIDCLSSFSDNSHSGMHHTNHHSPHSVCLSVRCQRAMHVYFCGCCVLLLSVYLLIDCLSSFSGNSHSGMHHTNHHSPHSLCLSVRCQRAMHGYRSHAAVWRHIVPVLR